MKNSVFGKEFCRRRLLEQYLGDRDEDIDNIYEKLSDLWWHIIYYIESDNKTLSSYAKYYPDFATSSKNSFNIIRIKKFRHFLRYYKKCYNQIVNFRFEVFSNLARALIAEVDKHV